MLRRLGARLQQAEVRTSKKHKFAHFPHYSLTRDATHVMLEDRKEATFPHHVDNLKQAAEDLACLSMCAPKVQWDARVIVLRDSPLEASFDMFINPVVPGYGMTDSVSPMYGMWETDTALGATCCWVIRPQRISVEYVDEFNQPHQKVLGGMKARLFLHEYDFLFGKSMLQMVPGSDFIVSSSALMQQSLWPSAFPSMEAQMTPANCFFDYVTNQIVVPDGFEWLMAMHQSNQQFSSEQLRS
jgi:peptide deformylase